MPTTIDTIEQCKYKNKIKFCVCANCIEMYLEQQQNYVLHEPRIAC